MLGAALLSAMLGTSVPLLATPTLGALGSRTLVQAGNDLGLKAFILGTPDCPPRRKRCIELFVHVVVQDDKPVQTPAWVGAHVQHANKLFEPVGVGFRVARVAPVDASSAEIHTRRQRDHLGRRDHSLGIIHVYVVRYLADVDIVGEQIRGVHWRDRGQPERRWIILSAIGSNLVLAHELGHFFGLPHSRYKVSIMNKRPRPWPPWPLRVFHGDELKIMAEQRDAMLEDGTLVAVRRRRTRRSKSIR